MIADKLSMSVFEMKNSLSVEEYLGWGAYLTKKPPEPNELQMATLMSMVSGMFGGKAKPDDFMIYDRKKSATETNTRTAFDSFNAVATDYKPMV